MKLFFFIFFSKFFLLSSMLIPSFSKTSADPHFEVIDLFPCFTTLTPKPANTIAAAVEIFSVCFPSPPVPQVSIEFFGTLILINFFLRLFAAEKIFL